MFCIQDAELQSIHSQPHRQHRGILRSFRSHKSLKSAARSQESMHQRHPSDTSSFSDARSSAESCRPSMSRPERFGDLDPLRLNPVHATSHLPLAVQRQGSTRNHDLRQARSLHNLHGSYQTSGPATRPTHSRTVIYDGFDFGFEQMESSRRRHPMHDQVDDDLYKGRPYSPSGSSMSSSGSEFGPETPSDVHFQGLTPRPHPAGIDAVDYFKRGGWKRRGIVFETEVMASEEECFDLEMD